MSLISDPTEGTSQATRKTGFGMRFGLRMMMSGVTLLCIGLAAWSIYVAPFREQAVTVRWIGKMGGTVELRPASGPALQRFLVQSLLGAGSFSEAYRVILRDTDIPDKLQTQLGRLQFIEHLTLDGSAVDDRAIRSLGRPQNLESLSLRYTGISDQSLAEIARFPVLRTLRVTGAEVGDPGLLALTSSPSLEEVFIRWTNVTLSGVKAFRTSNTDCTVHFHVGFGGLSQAR